MSSCWQDWFILALVTVTALLILIGCAVEWSTQQRIDWFNRDHSRHETNTVNHSP